MPKILLKNADPMGVVYLDVRFSNGATPFNELEVVPGFPLWLPFGESIEIDVHGWSELLFRRNLVSCQVDQIPDFVSDLYRIDAATDESLVVKRIYPLPFPVSAKR